jgi:membrane protein
MFSQGSRLSRELLIAAFRRWNRLNAPRLGASLAYYALLSMAPLSILVVAICGLVFGRTQAEQYVLTQARSLAGPSGAATVETLIQNARHTGAGIFATGVAFITLFFGASGVFVELRDTLNTIWQVPEQLSSGIRGMLWQRLAAFGMVLGLGLLLVISLSLSAVFAFLEHFARSVLPLPAAVTGEVLNLLVSLFAMSVLFGLIFKFVPETPIPWRDVTIGGAVTAVLFMIGRALLALYFSTSAVGSMYGAAGSVVALVVWVYYSAQIFFFGAVFTRVYAERFGSRRTPNARKQAK